MTAFDLSQPPLPPALGAGISTSSFEKEEKAQMLVPHCAKLILALHLPCHGPQRILQGEHSSPTLVQNPGFF